MVGKHLYPGILMMLMLVPVCKLFSQVSINDPGCAVVGKSYNYYCVGNCNVADMTWCISSNGTILQAYGSNITGTGTCRTGTAVSAIVVKWNSAGPSNVTLTTPGGNAGPLNFTVAAALVPGTISSASQTIGYNTVPATISCGVSTFGACSPSYSYQWQSSADNVQFTDISGQTSQNLTFTIPILLTTYYRRKVTETTLSTTLYSNVATVVVTAPFSTTTITPGTQDIYTGTAPLPIAGPAATGGSCSGNYEYQWESSNDGSSFVEIEGATGLSLTPGILSGRKYYRRKDVCGNQLSYSNIAVVNVFQHLSAGTLSPASQSITYNTSPVAILSTPSTGDMCTVLEYQYQWQRSSDGVNFSDIPEANGYSGYLEGLLNETTYYRRRVACLETAYSNVVVVNVRPQLVPGRIKPGGILITANTSPGQLTMTPAEGGACSNTFTYQWQQSLTGLPFSWTDVAGATGLNFTPGNLTVSTYYVCKVTCGMDVSYTNICKVTIGVPLYNFIQHRTINVPDVTSEIAAAQLNDPNVVSQQTQYFDGLGRPLQQVSWKNTPGQKDLVVPNSYDEFGRELIKYLPYASTMGDGKFRSLPLAEQLAFYSNGASDKVADDSRPYSETIFEQSPLGRVVKQGAPGEAWQPKSVAPDRSIKKEYYANGPEEVVLFTYHMGSISAIENNEIQYYAENQLSANKTLDEHNNEVVEFVDKEGKTVLKKVQYNDVSGIKLYADTYYIYDNLGNLVMVLPPEATRKLLEMNSQN